MILSVDLDVNWTFISFYGFVKAKVKMFLGAFAVCFLFQEKSNNVRYYALERKEARLVHSAENNHPISCENYHENCTK